MSSRSRLLVGLPSLIATYLSVATTEKRQMHAVKQHEAHDGAFTGLIIKKVGTITSARTLTQIPETNDWSVNELGSDTR